MNEGFKDQSDFALLEILRAGLSQPDEIAIQFLRGLTTKAERMFFLKRDEVHAAILTSLQTNGSIAMQSVAKKCGCSEDLVERVWVAIRDEYPPTPAAGDFCIAVPKEERAKKLVENILLQSGFRMDAKAKTIVDIQNGMDPIAYRSERGRDIPVYMKAGVVQCGFVGNDKIIEVQSEALENGRDPVELDIRQQFFINAFRMCLAVPKDQIAIQSVADLQGKSIATSYPATLKRFLGEHNIAAREVTYLNGGVEAACHDLGYDAVMDIVETGGSLKKNNLITLGEPLYAGDMSLITLPEAQRPMADNAVMQKFMKRLGQAQQSLAA